MTTPAGDLPDWTRSITVADAPQLLLDTGGYVPCIYFGPQINTFAFQSINLIVNCTGAVINHVLQVVVTWTDGGLTIDQDVYTMWGSFVANTPGFPMNVTAPCKGAQCNVTIFSSGAGDTVSVQMVGSRRPVQAATIHCDPQGVAPAVFAVPADPIGIGATNTYRVGPSHGPMDWSFTQAGTFALIVFAEVMSPGGLIEPRVISAGGTSNLAAVTPLSAPGFALRVTIQNTSGVAATVSGRLMPERW